MAKTITLNLSDRGIAAFAELQREGIDPGRFVEKALVDEAHRLRGKAVHAAEVREHEQQHVGLDNVRDLPNQIDYVRPPR